MAIGLLRMSPRPCSVVNRSLDPRADNCVSRIFGQKNYMGVEQVERLPEKLPLLYAGLTR